MKPVLCELFQLKGRRKKKKKKHLEGFRVLRDQIETWGYREFEDCNMEGSLNGGKKKKKVKAFRYCMRKQRVWKLSTFLLYRFSVTAAYLISFLPFLIPFHTVNKYWQNLPASVEVSLHLNLFFWVQNFYALFILVWHPFFFRLFVFVFILDEHPWHTIDVFVTLLECHFKNKRTCLCCSIVL